MIDLHMHTTYSDGTENCETVLKKMPTKKFRLYINYRS